MYILSIDFGTSSVKTSLLDEKFKIVETTRKTYAYRVLKNLGVELDADTIFEAMVDTVRKFSPYADKIQGVAYDTFSPSLLLMNENGSPVYPILTHLDRRSRTQSRQIVDIFGLEYYRGITGVLPFSGGVSVTSLLWLMQNEPNAVKKTCMAGHLNTYIYKKLTGIWATDPVNASMMGIYETVTQSGWSNIICDELKLPTDKLPDIFEAGSVLGGLSKEASKLMGLKEGIPVGLGTNDVAASHIGAGNTRRGDVLNISGSSEMISVLSDTPVINPRYYLRNSATPGIWQLYATTVGGFALDWFREQFCREIDIDDFYEEYLPQVIEPDVESGVRFVQHLAEDRQSLEKKHGEFLGLTLATTREDMLIAVLKGINAPIVEILTIAGSMMELSPEIKITGGLVSPHYIDFKRRLMPGFSFAFYDNCPAVGNARLMMQHLQMGRGM